MSNRGRCRAPGGIRCREGAGPAERSADPGHAGLENVIQVNLSAGINCAVIGYTAQAPAAGLAAPVPGSQFPPM